mmetsp:Transcript_13826/g.22233  ORF Transcript_13826/g.22233 Transcript_13826/m.22233 type:complete len:582 (-) Transcript_13826:1975-3720(-)
MCCCSSNEGVFTWLSAVLVNIAFISLITWGATTAWPVGFALSAVYTAFLLGMARWLEVATQREYNNLEDGTNVEAEDIEDENDQSSPSAHSPAAKYPSLANLLYGLGILSLGVTGFFLPINIVTSCTGPSTYGHPRYVWKTDVSALPANVQEWAADDSNVYQDGNVGATFAYLPSSGITIFQGTDFSLNPARPERLWTVQGGSAPMEHVEYAYSSPLIVVSDTTVCFQSRPEQQLHTNRAQLYYIYCTNGIVFQKERSSDNNTNTSPPAGHYGRLGSFYTVDGALWFKEAVAIQQRNGDSGTMVYSLNTEVMVPTLHSTRIPYDSPDNDNSCDPMQVTSRRALLTLFVCSVPMAVLSIALWTTKQVPSMGITFFVSISLVYISTRLAIEPELGDLDGGPPFRLWFTLSGLICLTVSAYLLLSIDSSSRMSEPLRSSLVASAIAFCWGATCLFLDPVNDHDNLAWWTLWNIFVVWPLILIGAATNSISLLVMGGLGFMADAFRLADLGESTLFFFLVFSLTGLAVGILGYYFTTRYQPVIQRWTQAQVKESNRWLYLKYQRHFYSQDIVLEGSDNVDPSMLL